MYSALLGWIFARAFTLAPRLWRLCKGDPAVMIYRNCEACTRKLLAIPNCAHIVGSNHWLPRNCQIGSGCRLPASQEGIQCDQGVVWSPGKPGGLLSLVCHPQDLRIVQPLECLARSPGANSEKRVVGTPKVGDRMASLGKGRRLQTFSRGTSMEKGFLGP